MRRLASLLTALPLLLVACGGAPPGPVQSAPVSTTAPSGAASPSASAAEPPVAAPAPKISMESQREPFMQACMKKVSAPDYCACGFEQFRETFKDADLSGQLAGDDPRLVALKERTITQCGSKLPEDEVRGGFLKGCVATEPRRSPYCECAWTTFRKTLAVADFVGDFSGPRVDEAKHTAAASCKGKYPAEVARADFIKGCSKDDPSRAAACTCIWGKLRTKYTTEEIFVGVADLKAVPGLDQCK